MSTPWTMPVASQESRVSVLWEPRGFLALLALYALVHVAVRLAVSPILTIDDSREAVFGQTLEWGYLRRQPPLYNWLVWAAFRVFGVGLLGLTVVKYVLLFLAYAFVYWSARRILSDARLAALAAWSLLLMIPISWVVHETLTHNVAALAAAAATFYILVRLEETGGVASYAMLGFAIALGTLSKFNYLFFLGALSVAALTVESFRQRVLSPRILLTVGVALALVLPYVLWFYHNGFSMAQMYSEEVRADVRESYLEGVTTGLYYIVRVTLYYATPLWIVLPLAFWRVWTPRATPSVPAARLVRRFVLAALGLLLVGALGGGLTYLKFRWMMPVFFVFPLYFFSTIDRRRLDGARLTRYAGILLAAELAIIVAMAGNVYRGDRFGRPSNFNVPYDAAATEIAAAGFTRGTIAAGEGALAGNFRLSFPESRVVRLTNPDYVPPTRGGGQCLIVWDEGRDANVSDRMREFLASALDVHLKGDEPIRAVAVKYRFAVERRLLVRYLLFPDGTGHCR